MSVPGRLASYGLVLAAVFASAYAVGERLPGHEHSGAPAPAHPHGGTTMAPTGSADATLGLTSTVDGRTLVLTDHGPSSLRFRIERDGEPVTDFVDQHGATLHLLIVRRDLTGFQHVHPTMAADGTWSADDVDLSVPGVWRLVVESMLADADGTVELGTDIIVPGEMTAEAVPPPDDMVVVDGLMVMRDGLTFTVSPTTGVDRYLGQSAHLVAFREGDLAFVHLHPDNDVIGDYRFSTPLPGPGTYRLFLQFTRDGDVVTVPFTEVVQP
jgi:hypothetical protein